jgi:betaine-aldehyde dehydrogenase
VRDTSGACAQGFFVAPTVFDGCSGTITIVQEEIFGPVMANFDFDHEEDSEQTRHLMN